MTNSQSGKQRGVIWQSMIRQKTSVRRKGVGMTGGKANDGARGAAATEISSRRFVMLVQERILAGNLMDLLFGGGGAPSAPEITPMQRGQAAIDHQVTRGQNAIEALERIAAGSGTEPDFAGAQFFAEDLDRFDRFVSPTEKEMQKRLSAARKTLQGLAPNAPPGPGENFPR